MQHTKKNYPADPKGFQRWLEKMIKEDSIFHKIPGMMAFQMKVCLEKYYGGRWQLILALIKEGWYLTWRGWLSSFIWWFSDRMGWTKVYSYPQTERMHAHQRRHGCKCSGSPNCKNDNCIDDSLPKWFRKLTDKISGR